MGQRVIKTLLDNFPSFDVRKYVGRFQICFDFTFEKYRKQTMSDAKKSTVSCHRLNKCCPAGMLNQPII